jgi:hypothetical protein
MKLRDAISFRAMLAIAAMVLTLSMTRTASAQPPTTFDVKAVAGAEGQFNEFPLNFQLEYQGSEVRQAITIGGPGLQQFVAPVGAVNVVAIWWLGIRFPVQSHVIFCFPPVNGGCWCLCLQWTNFFPFPRPRLFWYFNPCC